MVSQAGPRVIGRNGTEQIIFEELKKIVNRILFNISPVDNENASRQDDRMSQNQLA